MCYVSNLFLSSFLLLISIPLHCILIFFTFIIFINLITEYFNDCDIKPISSDLFLSFFPTSPLFPLPAATGSPLGVEPPAFPEWIMAHYALEFNQYGYFRANRNKFPELIFFLGGKEESQRMLIDKLNHVCKSLYWFILLDVNFNPTVESLSSAVCFKVDCSIWVPSNIFQYWSSQRTLWNIQLRKLSHRGTKGWLRPCWNFDRKSPICLLLSEYSRRKEVNCLY